MTAADRARLIKLLGMLGSEHDGERAAAALQVSALVKRTGLTWEALVVGGASHTPNAPIVGQRQQDWMRAAMDAMMNQGTNVNSPNANAYAQQHANRTFTDAERAAMNAAMKRDTKGTKNQ